VNATNYGGANIAGTRCAVDTVSKDQGVRVFVTMVGMAIVVVMVNIQSTVGGFQETIPSFVGDMESVLEMISVNVRKDGLGMTVEQKKKIGNVLVFWHTKNGFVVAMVNVFYLLQ